MGRFLGGELVRRLRMGWCCEGFFGIYQGVRSRVVGRGLL